MGAECAVIFFVENEIRDEAKRNRFRLDFISLRTERTPRALGAAIYGLVQHGQFRYFRHLREPQVHGIFTSSNGNL